MTSVKALLFISWCLMTSVAHQGIIMTMANVVSPNKPQTELDPVNSNNESIPSEEPESHGQQSSRMLLRRREDTRTKIEERTAYLTQRSRTEMGGLHISQSSDIQQDHQLSPRAEIYDFQHSVQPINKGVDNLEHVLAAREWEGGDISTEAIQRGVHNPARIQQIKERMNHIPTKFLQRHELKVRIPQEIQEREELDIRVPVRVLRRDKLRIDAPATEIQQKERPGVTKVKHRVNAVGGVGNPALHNIPMSLGDEITYVVPSNTQFTTQKPIYGGIGDGVLPISLDTNGVATKNIDQEFIYIPNKSPHHLSSPPLNPGELLTVLSPNLLDSSSNQPLAPNNRPVSIGHLINLVENLTEDQHISSQLPFSEHTPFALNPFSNSFSVPQQIPNEISSSLPALQSLPLPRNELLKYKNDQPHISNYFNVLPDAIDRETPSSLLLSSSLEDKSEGVVAAGLENIPNCLKDTWCGLGIAAALAFGTVSALAVPFLTPAFGRKRRSIEYIVLSPDTADDFARNYVSLLKNQSSDDVPQSDKLLFVGLHDADDDSARKVFQRMEQFILSNKELFLDIVLQETKNISPQKELSFKDYILIPDDILDHIEKTRDIPASEARKTNETFEDQNSMNVNSNQTGSLKEIPWTLSDLSSESLPKPFLSSTSFLKAPASSIFQDDNSFVSTESLLDIVDDGRSDLKTSQLLLEPLIEVDRFNDPTISTVFKDYNTDKLPDVEQVSSSPIKNPYEKFTLLHKVNTYPSIESPSSIKHHDFYQNENHASSQHMFSYYDPPQSNVGIFKHPSNILSLVNAGFPQSVSAMHPFSPTYPAPPDPVKQPEHQSQTTASNTNLNPHNLHSHTHFPFSSITPQGSAFQSQIPTQMNNFDPQIHNPFLSNIVVSTEQPENSDSINLQSSIAAVTVPTNTFQPPREVASLLDAGYSSILLNLPFPPMSSDNIKHANDQRITNLPHPTQQPFYNPEPPISQGQVVPTGTAITSNNLLSYILQHQPSEHNNPLPPRIWMPDTSFQQSGTYPNGVSPIINNGHLTNNSPYFPNPEGTAITRFPSSNNSPHAIDHAKSFYKSVCSAVFNGDVPNSEIIQFIKEKCDVFKFTGLI